MTEINEICFAGKFLQTVDAKRRVSIPAFFHGQVQSKVFHITRGPDSNLFVYPKEVFVRMAARINDNFGGRGEKDREKRLYFQETLGDAQPVQCDQQGRVTVPEEFLGYAKIEKKVLIIGAFNKLVFWNPEEYNTFIRSSKMSPQERVSEFGWAEGE
jgi:MraZ protein